MIGKVLRKVDSVFALNISLSVLHSEEFFCIYYMVHQFLFSLSNMSFEMRRIFHFQKYIFGYFSNCLVNLFNHLLLIYSFISLYF